MKPTIITVSLIIVMTLLTTVIIIRAETNNNLDEVKVQVNELKLSQDRTQVPYQNDTYSVPTYTDESLAEIVVTSDDLLSADVERVIGTSVPMNKNYVNDTDVVESINRILLSQKMTYDDIPVQYKENFLKLRYLEMVEGVTEETSGVSLAIEEYNSTQGGN